VVALGGPAAAAGAVAEEGAELGDEVADAAASAVELLAGLVRRDAECRLQRCPARPPVPAARGIDPVIGFGVLTFGLAAVTAALLWGLAVLDPVVSWLIAVNLVTLGTYGYDKAIADTGWTRVPEAVLLALTFLGGTPCALVAMPLFHHKTAKAAFRLKFWLVVAGQVVLIALYFLVIRPWLAG
jgi:uncharacterized membrane protein YsdA (DUF1294 family)